MNALYEAIALEALFQEEAYDRFGFPRYVDGFNLREAGRNSWHEHHVGRKPKTYEQRMQEAMVLWQAKCDAYNADLEERGLVKKGKEWRGTPVFTFGNRAQRRAARRDGKRI